MFKTNREALAYVRELSSLCKPFSAEIVVAPPFTSLSTVVEAARNTSIGVAVQNIHFDKQGAFTGEVSADMAKDAGAEYAIIGHSERRRMFGDTDETVNKKVHAALAAGLTPIVCIGETLEERENGSTNAVLERQVRVGLSGCTAQQVADLIIAYEPVWAIGTGRNATPAEAGAAHQHIRALLATLFGTEAAEACRILYGGSVKPDNIAALRALPDVDGALVGGACLDVQSFFQIVSLGC